MTILHTTTTEDRVAPQTGLARKDLVQMRGILRDFQLVSDDRQLQALIKILMERKPSYPG